METEHRILGGEDAVGVFPHGVPVFLNATLLGQFTRRQTGFRITLGYVGPELLEFVTGAAQLVEGLGGTAGSLGRVLRNLLREHSQFGGVGDVFLIVLAVCIDNEQHHNEQDSECDQRGDQAGNQLVASLSHTESSGSVLHFLAPGLFKKLASLFFRVSGGQGDVPAIVTTLTTVRRQEIVRPRADRRPKTLSRLLRCVHNRLRQTVERFQARPRANP